jgi:hypothetical protein
MGMKEGGNTRSGSSLNDAVRQPETIWDGQKCRGAHIFQKSRSHSKF